MGKGIEVFLQVKVDPCERTDTKKPNNSPVVLIKPYYRWVKHLRLNKFLPKNSRLNVYLLCLNRPRHYFLWKSGLFFSIKGSDEFFLTYISVVSPSVRPSNHFPHFYCDRLRSTTVLSVCGIRQTSLFAHTLRFTLPCSLHLHLNI